MELLPEGSVGRPCSLNGHVREQSRYGSKPTGNRAFAQLLARYREPGSARGVFELVITAVPFLVIWALMWTVLAHGHWIGLLLAAPAAGLLVRLFMIQHDCGYGIGMMRGGNFALIARPRSRSRTRSFPRGNSI